MVQFWYRDELIKEGQKLVARNGRNPLDFVDVIKEIKSPEEIIVTLRAIKVKKGKNRSSIDLRCKNLSMDIKLLLEAFEIVDKWPIENKLKFNSLE